MTLSNLEGSYARLYKMESDFSIQLCATKGTRTLNLPDGHRGALGLRDVWDKVGTFLSLESFTNGEVDTDA